MSDNQPVILYCANHPSVQTSLRCKNCEKPICPKCAVLTPTGYSCKECVRGQQKVFETAEAIDYPIAFVIAGLLSFAGSFLAMLLGFFIIFLAPIAGVIIAEAVRAAVRRHRAPNLFLTTAVAAALGSLPLLLSSLLGMTLGSLLGRYMGGFVGGLWGLLWQGFYTVTVTSTVYYRMRGINIR
jgi:hypothetical protein